MSKSFETEIRGVVFSARRAESLTAAIAENWPNQPSLALSALQARAWLDDGEAWIFSIRVGGQCAGNAFGMLQRGRLRSTLMVTSLDTPPGGDAFIEGIQRFAAKKHITELLFECVGSSAEGAGLPKLEGETSRYFGERLYVMDLRTPGLEAGFSKNNRRNISKAGKSGVQTITAERSVALAAHFTLTESSLDRRATRGESTALRGSRQRVEQLVESGHGTLYQVALAGEIVSSMLVYAVGDCAYYYDGGSSMRGMEVGASNFLLNNLVENLRQNNFSALNLGIAAHGNDGLARFKEGFAAQLWYVERVVQNRSSKQKMAWNMVSRLSRAVIGRN